ncbi:MAG: UDP-N-acetylglucosamine 1-carboxyvinyltransferase [Myxococcales bacterium]|nr:UDP-N-acetylglucosamine 1-carboxyvinyltransferase [Myxococcales bacterium]
MDSIVIRGGHRLKGEVRISGAKNAALPILASSLLAHGTSTFKNVPLLNDVATMRRLLIGMGATVEPDGGISRTLRINTDGVDKVEASYELVKTMRASVLVLGPLLTRHGRAVVSLPGGCAIGERPIDQHLKGLEAMGAKIILEHGNVVARAKRLHGASIVCDIPTVTGTENLMMAASLARGRTTLENAAREPEVEELGRVLNKMGAHIEGAGTSMITIEGVEELQPIEHAIMPDRIEAGTFLVAAALTRGDVLVRDVVPEHMEAIVAKLRSAGAEVTPEGDGLRVRGRAEIQPVDITTQPFPGFPTDMQAQFMVLATRARGQSVITETIFENRYMHVQELRRMGADIVVDGRTSVIRGVPKLSGAKVMATDLRASASLILAGLVAEGETEVLRVYHLDRGYEKIERKLRALGADVRRMKGRG